MLQDPVLTVAAKLLGLVGEAAAAIIASEDMKWLRDACKEEPDLLTYELAEIGLIQEASKRLDDMILAKLIEDGKITREEADQELEDNGIVDCVADALMEGKDLIDRRDFFQDGLDELKQLDKDLKLTYEQVIEILKDRNWNDIDYEDALANRIMADVDNKHGRWALEQSWRMFDRWLNGENMVIARVAEC